VHLIQLAELGYEQAKREGIKGKLMRLPGGKGTEKSVKPIFILGVAHSGTTILYNMLAFHPDLAWFSQYSQRDGTAPERFYLPFEAVFNRVLRRLFKHSWQKGKGFWTLAIPFPSEADRIWNYILPESRQGVGEEEIKRRMKTIIHQELSRWHRNAIIFKLPRLSTELTLLREVFPQALFIHIIRDGRAVALSLRHKFQRRERDELKALRLSAERWKDVVVKIRQEKGNTAHFLEINYESFCNDVYGHVVQCLDLAGLEKSKMPWQRFPARLTPTNDKWLRNCSESERLLLEQVLGGALTELGYEKGEWEQTKMVED
jgi:hypothetical protein